jgi:L-amino acid N-acyltransferase YncA
MNGATLRIRALQADDWPSVRSIYEEGIATGHATFERQAPSWEEWNRSHLPDHRLVLLLGEDVVGWAALSPVSERCVYGGVAEVSVYVAARARGRRVGKDLLGALVASSEAGNIWTLQAGIFPENVASLALHRRCGFRIVGVREKLGRLNGVWRDVVLLERRQGSSGVVREIELPSS